MLLVSLVHQFIWPTFTLVLTRNGIFKYSQALNKVEVENDNE